MRIIILIAIVSLSLFSGELSDYKYKSAPGIVGNNHDYPKLAMWWPSSWEPYRQTVEELARYDYIGWGYWDNIDFINSVKSLNPKQKEFMSFTATELSWEEFNEEGLEAVGDKLRTIPAEWFLLQKGSFLLTGTGKTDTVISVKSTLSEKDTLFKKGDLVACNYETMKVNSVDYVNNKLFVERGYYREATNHNINDKVAAHISFWPGSCVMNLTADCPKAEALNSGRGKERWIDWFADVLFPIFYPNTLDGVIEDRVEYGESWLVPKYARSIDFNGTMDEFDTSWKKGLEVLIPKIRAKLNGKPITANSFGAFYKILNGTIYESCPGNWSDTKEETYEDWASGERPYVLGEEGYINVSKNSVSPNYSFVETYYYESMPDGEENNPFGTKGWSPDYKKMRYGLTTALLGDGYFSYEVATWGHGMLGLFWFDEYDNGGDKQGYLGQPKGNYYEILDNGEAGKAFRRDFDNGVVLCNPSNDTITYDLGKAYREIKGKQCPNINGGNIIKQIKIAPHDGRILLNKDYKLGIKEDFNSHKSYIYIDERNKKLIIGNTTIDEYKIDLYTLNGKRVFSRISKSHILKIPGTISSGTYIVNLSDSKKDIIKQRIFIE